MEFNMLPQDNLAYLTMDLCCQKIIEKMGGEPISLWRSADYNRLSSQLGIQTKIYISENTLKRIFGRLKTSRRYFPQKATRDALAQFVGYRDWDDIENECANIIRSDQGLQSEKNNSAPATEPNTTGRRNNRQKQIAALLLIVILLGVCGWLFWRKNIQERHFSAELVCKNPAGGVPHTAIFELRSRIREMPVGNYEIDFLDEAPKTVISGTQKLTKLFRNPGVVYATLYHNKKPIDTTTVLLQTNGWVANSGNDSTNAYPIAGLRALDKNNLYVSEDQLDSAGLDLSKHFLVGFSNIRSTNINGDNFTFSATVSAEENRPGNQCVGVTIVVLGSKDRHVIKLYRKKCAAFCFYKFSNVSISGADQYLGNLAFDPKNGGKIRLEIKSKKAELFLNNKQVLTTSYQNSIGKVMGLKILIDGIGRVINPTIIDLNTNQAL